MAGWSPGAAAVSPVPVTAASDPVERIGCLARYGPRRVRIAGTAL